MQLQLDLIAARLEGLEETIINKLIDRAQFCENAIAYTPGKSGFTGNSKQSLLEIRLTFQEDMDAQFGRYFVPEERPFTKSLPEPRRAVDLGDTGLHLADCNAVNLTGDIYAFYRDLLPYICQSGDDEQYGSTVEHDVFALQAISRRIHYGAFYVAECKYQAHSEEYQQLIEARNSDGLLAKLTRQEVEDKIIERVREKVAYAQAKVNRKVRKIIDPEIVLTCYRDHIIPLTKKGEIEYLMKRQQD